MTAPEVVPNLINGAAAIFSDEANLSEEDLGYVDLSGEWRAELLDPEGWNQVLETFAGTMKMAVALTDLEGRLLGSCHNPQPVWHLARGARPAAGGACPFCLGPPGSCRAVADALATGAVVTVNDQAGLSHVAIPLSLGGQPLGVLIAGQVFTCYPEILPLQRVARDLGISSQDLWHQAIQQAPLRRATLQLYANLLGSLGEAFLGQRYAAILQRKLAQTSHRYRLFFDGVKDYALLTVDRAGRVTSWNIGAERMFGYREAEIIGQSYSCLLEPGDAALEVTRQSLAEADRLGWVECEGWRVRKDGTRFLCAGLLAAMGEGDNREYGRMIRDITEHRRSEQDLQQAQKMEGIGVLAGGIAHDFNNLLTGIMGGLSLVKTSLPPDDPAYPMVELAEQSSVRAAELVAQLLAYAGKGRFMITRFDFSALIEEMVPLIAASIPKTVDLELLLASGLPWIEADASQIRQIVMNLIINGAEAIGADGGTVRVSTGISDSGTSIFMQVKDSGSGMSDATKAKIFDPFFTTKFTGRGLGLAAVSGIVRGHQGQMQVDSTPGQGTTFTVFFPAVQAGALRLVNPPKSTVPRGTGTVLVVDDEPALRKMAGMILENSGYSVLAARDGREAVEIFRQNASKIVAVLLDMTMPVMGGHDAFELIRQIRPGVAVLLTSGYSETFAREELGRDIVAGFIQKPYSADKLVKSIQEAVHPAARQSGASSSA
ncbi:MAG TPA: ATP-binding protein [Candidatus Acidoferrales bacterium]|nr:ATP-binding protein [Candidatus Acidoferrales bacterium]